MRPDQVGQRLAASAEAVLDHIDDRFTVPHQSFIAR
jgi:hypothetical protein